MTVTEHPLIARTIAAEPGIGAGDESQCLPGWLNSFCEWHEAGKGATLSPAAVRALTHTLIAARQRARRLAAERDRVACEAESERRWATFKPGDMK